MICVVSIGPHGLAYTTSCLLIDGLVILGSDEYCNTGGRIPEIMNRCFRLAASVGFGAAWECQ